MSEKNEGPFRTDRKNELRERLAGKKKGSTTPLVWPPVILNDKTGREIVDRLIDKVRQL